MSGKKENQQDNDKKLKGETTNDGDAQMAKNDIIATNSAKKKGQYFTKSEYLKKQVNELISKNQSDILEPSFGRGDLVEYVTSMNDNNDIAFDMYEIDETIPLLPSLHSLKTTNIFYDDFLKVEISKKYDTIIGNPPYVRTSQGNLFLDFTQKCFDILNDDGELIFIVPSEFFKLTSATKLLNDMMTKGTFTDIVHPNDESLFENASVDVIVYRYCKNNSLEKKVLYNDELMYITNSNGLITFSRYKNESTVLFKDLFDIHVGLVTGKEKVYKHKTLGNIDVLNGEDNLEKYIHVESFPHENKEINDHLTKYKSELIGRRIRKFNENNWFEWGALRNIDKMRENMGSECIYLYNLTRKPKVCFVGNVNYFGGGLIMLRLKGHSSYNINKIATYINSDAFKTNFMFSGRFKIGHRQISNSYIPLDYLVKL